MKSKNWLKTNKLKVIFFLLAFLLTLLVNSSSFASILSIEANNSIKNKNLTFFTDTKKRRLDGDLYGFSRHKLGRDYEFIFFYSLNCQYCKSFEPILKSYSDNSGITVRGFILGLAGNSTNQRSNYFPNSTVVKQGVIESFFGISKGKNIAVPALFIMNKKNLHVYPVSRGALTYLELVRRMNELSPKMLNNEAKMVEQNHA